MCYFSTTLCLAVSLSVSVISPHWKLWYYSNLSSLPSVGVLKWKALVSGNIPKKGEKSTTAIPGSWWNQNWQITGSNTKMDILFFIALVQCRRKTYQFQKTPYSLISDKHFCYWTAVRSRHSMYEPGSEIQQPKQTNNNSQVMGMETSAITSPADTEMWTHSHHHAGLLSMTWAWGHVVQIKLNLVMQNHSLQLLHGVYPKAALQTGYLLPSSPLML